MNLNGTFHCARSLRSMLESYFRMRWYFLSTSRTMSNGMSMVTTERGNTSNEFSGSGIRASNVPQLRCTESPNAKYTWSFFKESAMLNLSQYRVSWGSPTIETAAPSRHRSLEGIPRLLGRGVLELQVCRGPMKKCRAFSQLYSCPAYDNSVRCIKKKLLRL